MTVDQYFHCLSHLSYLASALPQSEGHDLLEEDELVQVAYQGCPKPWRSMYKCQGCRIYTETFNTLKDWMSLME